MLMRPAMDASMKILLGATIIVVTIAMFLWNSVPRLMRDVWHARDFILAQSHTMTDYKCTNWNGVMFNECTATFVSSQGGDVAAVYGLAVRPGAKRAGPAVAAPQ
jgi:hypothetical protein